nr:hypothetical protein CFP56_77562 [Quercus suber]
MEKVDRAVTNARRNIIAAGESVTAWKVSQDALLILNLDSWSSLGFPMQEVPSLHRLMLTEGKINAFIHCFVGVQRVTTLYDLEVAICKNEGVDNFEKLELGPLLRHPLVLHYFSLKSDATEVIKITGEERRSVASKEELCIRVQNLGMHVSAIRKAMSPQTAILTKPVDATSISQCVESFSSARKDFRGKNIRFASSSSNDDENSDDSKDANLPSQNVASSD